MNRSDTGFMGCMEQDRCMEFCRSIIEGVEIKLCRNDSHAYKHHIHNELSLGYILEGSTDLTLNDRIIRYESGNGVIIPPLMTHRCAPKEIDHWAYVMLFIDPGYYGNLISFHRAEKLTGNQASQLIGFIQQLEREQCPDAMENILIELLLEFGGNGGAEASVSEDGDAVRTVHDYILNHVNDEITLDHLVQISGLNKFSLIRNFKKQYVTTPSAYHLQHRVAEAKRLLGKGADVFEVCDRLRFYDQAHLIHEFKKMYGVTPGTYIEQMKA
jgi:AraC-type DNA-binding domain-containing proteins